MSIEKVIIDAVKFQNLFNLAAEARHDKPFNLVSVFLEDIKKSVKLFVEAAPVVEAALVVEAAPDNVNHEEKNQAVVVSD